MRLAPEILQSYGRRILSYISIWDRYIKSERGCCILVCYWDKPLSVSKNSAPTVHHILCETMSKKLLCTVQKVGSEDMNLYPFL